MLWIRIGFFNADPDPAFYLNANPDPDPGLQTNADRDAGQTFKSQKVKFLDEIIIKERLCASLHRIRKLKKKSFHVTRKAVCLFIRPRAGNQKIFIYKNTRMRSNKAKY